MTTLQLLQPIYTTLLNTLNTVYTANYHPGDITFPTWPTLPANATYECQLAYIIAAIICLLEWIECLEEGGPTSEVQACVDAKNAVFLIRIGDCVASS